MPLRGVRVCAGRGRHLAFMLLALGCEAAPKPLTEIFLTDHHCLPGAAAQPSGSKLPRHDDSVQSRKWRRTQAPWRASLLALGCEAAQKPVTEVFLTDHHRLVRAAAQPSASKLPRHRDRVHAGVQGVLRSEAVDCHHQPGVGSSIIGAYLLSLACNCPSQPPPSAAISWTLAIRRLCCRLRTLRSLLRAVACTTTTSR